MIECLVLEDKRNGHVLLPFYRNRLQSNGMRDGQLMSLIAARILMCPAIMERQPWLIGILMELGSGSGVYE